MSLPEYKNLTRKELDWAEHCAESGNFTGLREMQELSANREGKSARDTLEYILPLRPIRN